MADLRFQLTKQLYLVAQLTRGMQNLKSRPKSSGRSVTSLGGKLDHFAQSNCRNKQENKPCAGADVSGGVAEKKPGYSRNRQNDKRSNAPAMIRGAGAPCPRQHHHRRNDCEKKQNVIQVHAVDLIRSWTFGVGRWMLGSEGPTLNAQRPTLNVQFSSCPLLSLIILMSFHLGVFGPSRHGLNCKSGTKGELNFSGRSR